MSELDYLNVAIGGGTDWDDLRFRDRGDEVLVAGTRGIDGEWAGEEFGTLPRENAEILRDWLDEYLEDDDV